MYKLIQWFIDFNNKVWPWPIIIVGAIIVWSIIGSIISSAVAAPKKHHEKFYQEQVCEKLGGVAEYRLPDGTRVDCLTKMYAIEFDFAPKWAEAIGQSLYYASQTNRKAKVIIIDESGTCRHHRKVVSTIYLYHLPLAVQYITYTNRKIKTLACY